MERDFTRAAQGMAFYVRPFDHRGRFGRAERVYRIDRGEGPLEAANLDFDPATGDAVAIWSHARGTSTGFPYPWYGSTVQAAPR